MLILSIILFWIPAGGHATRLLFTTEHLHKAIPGNNKMANAFQWMKAELPRTAVVAANWSYVRQLNVLAGVKTVVDPDHYIQHWIHLYHRHVNFATSEREALDFLKTHTATHLMLAGEETATVPFLHGETSDAFVPVYPARNFANALVKVWEIHYPPDIQPNLKYLETGFPEIDKALPLQ